jgi:hypothetical protein
MGAISGASIYGFTRGLDDAAKANREQASFDQEQALFPLRKRAAELAVQNEEALGPERVRQAQAQADIGRITADDLQDQAKRKAFQQKMKDGLDAAHRDYFTNGSLDGFSNFLSSTNPQGEKITLSQTGPDTTGAGGITFTGDKGTNHTILSGQEDFTTNLGIPKELPADQKLSYFTQWVAQPDNMLKMMEASRQQGLDTAKFNREQGGRERVAAIRAGAGARSDVRSRETESRRSVGQILKTKPTAFGLSFENHDAQLQPLMLSRASAYSQDDKSTPQASAERAVNDTREEFAKALQGLRGAKTDEERVAIGRGLKEKGWAINMIRYALEQAKLPAYTDGGTAIPRP